MSSVGYPDWYDAAQAAGDPIVNVANAGFNPGPVSFGPFAISSARSLVMLGQMIVSAADIVVSYLPSSELGTAKVQQRISVPNGVWAHVIPVLGDTVNEIAVSSPGAGGRGDLWVAPSMLEPWSVANLDSSYLAAKFGTNVGAGVTNSYAFPAYAGLASLAFESSGALTLEIVSTFADGVTKLGRSFYETGIVGVRNQIINIPPLYTTAKVTNLTAGALTFTLSVQPQKRP